MAHEANGPLLEFLAESINYHDKACVQMLREGGDLVGVLPRAGNGTPIEPKDIDTSILLENRAEKNDKMMHALRLDVHANELIEITKKDAALHRMSAPRRFDPYGDEGPDTANVTFSPRFAVIQGCFVCSTAKCIMHVLCG